MKVTIKDIIKNYKYYIVNTNKKYLVGKTSRLMDYDIVDNDTYELVELNHKTALLKSVNYDRDKDVVVHDSEGTLGECLDWIERQEPREVTLKDLRRLSGNKITELSVEGHTLIYPTNEIFREMRNYIVADIVPTCKVEDLDSGVYLRYSLRICLEKPEED